VVTPDEKRLGPIELASFRGRMHATFYQGGCRVSDELITDGTKAWPATEADKADAPPGISFVAVDEEEHIGLLFSGWYVLRGSRIRGEGLAAIFGAILPE
jgi:hypothetical protein